MVNAKFADVVYDKVKSQLKGQEGKIIAIDTETGDYFVGKNIIEAYEEGHKKYPHKQFFFMRIGQKAVYRAG